MQKGTKREIEKKKNKPCTIPYNKQRDSVIRATVTVIGRVIIRTSAGSRSSVPVD